MDEFFDGKRDHTKFAGEGFSLELIRRYGIRVSEPVSYTHLDGYKRQRLWCFHSTEDFQEKPMYRLQF